MARLLPHGAVRVALALAGIGAMTGPASAQSIAAPAEMRAKAEWVGRHLRGKQPAAPFSFRYGARPSGELLPTWRTRTNTRRLDAARTQTTTTWRDPATGLQVRCLAVDYADYPAIEWTVYLKNTGAANTPILEDVQGLDSILTRGASGEFVLRGIKGDWCSAESFQPYELTMAPGTQKRFAPQGSGRSCDGPDGFPYFNLSTPDGGVLIAVGWPGQWAATFARDDSDGLRVRAGQELTHLYLKPGEEIRTPLIAMVFWRGADVVRSQNLWRRWYLAHNLPRTQGKPQPPITQIQVDAGDPSLPDVQPYLDAGVKPDICWRDAGGGRTWYPSSTGPYTGGDVWLNTGTWDVDPAKYPNGFRPFSDRIRALGMRFLLWFEPERVGDPNSWLGKNHPEWLLPGTNPGALLDEGNPEARTWLTNHVDAIIHAQGLDWYREDMNGDGPLPAWRRHDAADRQGITENLYVQGHLAYWDELRRRNPDLRIDSCASGGRRDDLETMRRAVPLLRSDFQFPSMAGFIEGNQAHTYGISSWLPWYGSGVYSIEPYAVRSFLMPGFGAVPPGGWEKSAATRAAVKRAHDEAILVAPLMLGDYYPLSPYSLQPDRWIAWQFNRPEHGDGMVQAFRRPACAEGSATYRLSGLEAGTEYVIRSVDAPAERKVTGAALMHDGLAIDLPSKPSAALITYRKAR